MDRTFYDDVGDVPEISLDEEIACARILNMTEKGSPLWMTVRDRLIFGNLPFIRRFIKRFYVNSPDALNDAISEANVGMTIAASRYQPQELQAPPSLSEISWLVQYCRKDHDLLTRLLEGPTESTTTSAPRQTGRFISYARFWVTQRILAHIYDSRGVAIPPMMRKLLRQYRQFCARMFDQYGREPTSQEIQQQLQLDPAIFAQLMAFLGEPLSLHEPLNHHDDLNLETVVASADPGSDDRVEQIGNQEMVQQALNVLPTARMRRIIQLRYGLLRHPETDEPIELSLEHIGVQFNLVRQQITTHEQRAMMLMRDALTQQTEES